MRKRILLHNTILKALQMIDGLYTNTYVSNIDIVAYYQIFPTGVTCSSLIGNNKPPLLVVGYFSN